MNMDIDIDLDGLCDEVYTKRRLKGKVKDSADGSPIAEVEVTLVELFHILKTVYTDKEGNYLLEWSGSICQGVSLEIGFQKHGYTPTSGDSPGFWYVECTEKLQIRNVSLTKL